MHILGKMHSHIKEFFYVDLRETLLARIESGELTEDMELSSVLDSLAEIGCVPRNCDQLVRFRNSRWALHIYINSSEWTSPRIRAGRVQWTASHKSFERFRAANDGARCHESKKRATPTDV
jgi:hypothetical protein